MGVAIAEHVAAGQDVHVLWITPGESSGVRSKINGAGIAAWWGIQHTLANESYVSLSPAEFGEARLREGHTAIACLATGLSGTITTHTAVHLVDGSVTVTGAAEAIQIVADQIAPSAPVRIKTHSHIVDDHSDHVAIANAARQLAAANPTRFGDLRHYILPSYWSDVRLSQVVESIDNPTNATITSRVQNACRAYGAWHPPHSYAIGYHSVSSMFNTLVANPHCVFHS